MNRPLYALSHILNPWAPTTLANDELFLSAVQRLAERDPETVFALACAVLKQRGMWASPSFPEFEPLVEIRDLRGLLEARSGGQSRRVEAFLDEATRFAASHGEQWAKLLGSTGFSEDVLDRLEGELRVDDPSLELRDALGNHLNWWLNHGNDESHTVRVRALFDRFAPEDLVTRAVEVFRRHYRAPDIVGEWETREAETERRRRELAFELVSQGRAAVEAVAESLDDSLALASALAKLESADAPETWLREAESTGRMGALLAPFLAVQVFDGNRDTADALQSVKHEPHQCLDLALRLRAEPSLWGIVEEHGLARAYWSAIPWFRLPQDSLAALPHLLEVDNNITAFEVLAHAKSIPEAEFTIRVLERAMSDARVPEGVESFHFWLRHVFAKLARSAIEDSRLVLLAFRAAMYFDDLDLPWLDEALENPVNFAQLVVLGRTKEGVGARRVLFNVRKLPHAHSAELLPWYEAVRAKANQDSDAEAVWFTSQIAQLFSHAPCGLDGIWPSVGVREVLEHQKDEELVHALAREKWNRRGMTSRGMGEGGRQERKLSEEFRIGAELLALGCPVTSSLLSALAIRYERDARRNDASAATLRSEEGLEKNFAAETVLTALTLLAERPAGSFEEVRDRVASRLRFEPYDVGASLRELQDDGLFDDGIANIAHLVVWLRGLARTQFRAVAKVGRVLGHPTAHSYPQLARDLATAVEDVVVIPAGAPPHDAAHALRHGTPLAPIHPQVTILLGDAELYKLIVWFDAERLGDPRVRKLATALLPSGTQEPRARAS